MFRLIVLAVALVTAPAPARAFLHGDLNDDKRITIDEVISIVNGVLECDFGCREDQCECGEYISCGVTFCTYSDEQAARCDRLVQGCVP